MHIFHLLQLLVWSQSTEVHSPGTMVDGIGMLPYSERLEAMNLTSLCERCIRGDLIETFKIVSGVAYYGIRVE